MIRQSREFVRRWLLTTLVGGGSLALLIAWLVIGRQLVTAESARWTMSALTTSSAALLGLALVSHVFSTDRADRSVDYLRGKQRDYIKRLEPVLNDLIAEVSSRIPADGARIVQQGEQACSYLDALRSLLVIRSAVSFGKYSPPGETMLLIGGSERSTRADIRSDGAALLHSPADFVAEICDLGFFLRSKGLADRQLQVFESIQEDYFQELWSHLCVLDDAERLRGLKGKLLIGVLATTFLLGLFTLSVMESQVPVWALGATLCMAVAAVLLLVLIIDDLFG